MSYRKLSPLFFFLAVGCGDSPTSSTSVSVVYPAGGPIFIGDTAQLEARVSGGGSSSSATWSSDAPSVATVSSTGLVTALRAGQATITASVNPSGSMLIQIYPNFHGTWIGNEVVVSCQATDGFAGICDDPTFGPGTVFDIEARFTQSEATVQAVVGISGQMTAEASGTIGVGGLLQLPSAPYLPPVPPVHTEMRNWRSRADTPGLMTGSYETFFSVEGFGTVTTKSDLRDLAKTGANPTSTSTMFSQHAQRTIMRYIGARR